MTIAGAIVLFSVTWFMVFLCILPTRQTTQAEAGEIVPGSAQSAPTDPQIGRKAKLTTIITLVVWGMICGIIMSGWISPFDTDFFGLVPRVKL